ncbi:MAG TPA: hypothetical protein VM915_10020, partial [Verrucomicrobiae bacterium]|nr:hypothetical protein [Verrucomicrobiae bacterium]
AKDRVMMGAERRSMAMTEDEKKATAVHEAGHALVNIFVPGNDPLHKVTIIPRGRALGVTWSLPEADVLSYSKKWCEAKIAMAFGGRVAEQLARKVLTEHRDDLTTLANALVEYETLSGEEVTRVLRGEKLDRPEDTPQTPLPPTPALPVTDEDEAPARGGWGGAAPQGA